MASGFLDAAGVKKRVEKKLQELEEDDGSEQPLVPSDRLSTTSVELAAYNQPSSGIPSDVANATRTTQDQAKQQVGDELDPDLIEWDYVDNVDDRDEIVCGICISVLDDPQLMTCCGDQLVCKKCVKKSHERNKKLRQSPQCPFCRSEKFKVIPETDVKNTILGLKVRCPQKKDGCQWAGTRQEATDHLKNCNFLLVSCPYNCTPEKFKRPELEEHLCVCPEKPEQCFFYSIGCKELISKSKAGHHARDAIHHHLLKIATENARLSEECRTASVSSSTSSEKITFEKRKKVEVLKKHLSQSQDKLICLENKLRENKQVMDGLLERNVQKGAQCVTKMQEKSGRAFQLRKLSHGIHANLETLKVPVVEGFIPIPATFTLDKFSERKANNDKWLSPPFYSHLGGYKMQLSVYPNGQTAEAKGKYVSIYIQMMKGEHDDKLIWPFQGAVITVLILNQRNTLTNMALETHGHARSEFRVTGQLWNDVCQRVTDGSSCLGRGDHEFISHSRVGRYLKNDTLKVKVYHIDFLPL